MNRKPLIITTALALLTTAAIAQTGTTKRIGTTWGAQLDKEHPLPDYPRPQLVRNDWVNLNGAWQYKITPKEATTAPDSYVGNIVVPFAVESALSGVNTTVGKDSVLWYHRSVAVPAAWRKGKVLLHFGAVDWRCEVWINGQPAGSHEGGYDPFSFDITSALKGKNKADIVVRVWDPSDDGPQPRGKQVKSPNGIWYTPVTGIWQTVWLEPVPEAYISDTRQTPDINKGTLTVQTTVNAAQPGDELLVTASKNGQQIAEQRIAPNATAVLNIPQPELWSPEHPFLYDLKTTLLRKGKKIDQTSGYFAMRKISMGKDQQGIQRMLLNDKFAFQYGPLDQGWWPDGLYTAPSDAALLFDIEQTKAMGFNMIRKHVKTEPARWYYHCDKLGMLVWQDMPSGDLGNRWEPNPGVYGLASDQQRSAASEQAYRSEWKEIMQDLYNFPCIVVWVPFNEAWGQFKTREITEWTMQQDPSRLVNSASGGNFEPVGHIVDLHHYPDPSMPDPSLFGANRILVLGEFGGLGLPVQGHTWQEKDNWGYQRFKTKEELLHRYKELIDRLPHLIQKGLSAAVYTQTTDVEVEINGIMTYDRKEIKMPAQSLKTIHSPLYNASLVEITPQ